MKHVPEFREFRYIQMPIRMSHGYSLLTLLGILPFLPVVLDQGWELLFTPEGDLRLSAVEQIILLGGPLLLAAIMGFAVWAAGRAGLRVDANGFQCDPPLNSSVTEVTPHPWRLGWSAINRAVLYLPPARERSVIKWVKAVLCLQTGDRKYCLPLLYLDPRNAPIDRRLPFLPSRMRRKVRTLLLEHPLLAMIEAKGVPLHVEDLDRQTRRRLKRNARKRKQEARTAGQVDLLGQPSTILLLGVLSVLGLFLAMHYMVLPPVRPLWEPALWLPVLGGVAAFLLAAVVAARVRTTERFALAAMVGVATALVWNPAELRLQLSGQGPGEVLPYVAMEPALFVPQQGDYPVIDLRDVDVPEYWNAYPAGAEHPFHVLALGQERFVLSLGPLFERTQAFYANE